MSKILSAVSCYEKLVSIIPATTVLGRFVAVFGYEPLNWLRGEFVRAFAILRCGNNYGVGSELLFQS